MPLPFRCLQGNFICMKPFDLRRLGRWLVCAALVFPVAAGSAEVTYQNPVIPGDHPDPSIIRVGKDYWATCTSSAWGPLFPLLHSRDLVNWDQTGAVLNQRPDWAVGDFWAPEISEYHGKYFVYFVGRQHDGRLAVAVATAKKPGGPYTDHGPLVAQADGSIDPMPVTDVDGARYLIWKEDGNSRGQPTPIWAQRLDDDGTKLVGQPRELIRNDVAWEGPLVEGPYILRRNGWFYLFYSGNGCCGRGCSYALGVARSRSLFGPWQKNPANPILAGNAVWKCPGHGSVVQDKQGRCWFLYHAYSAKGTIFTGREGMLDEIKFGTDEWPTMNTGGGPSVKAPSPFGLPQKAAAAAYTDNFTGDKLDYGWRWPQDRQPLSRLQHGRLVLTARGNHTNLLAAVLARSTTVPDYVAETVVETGHLQPGCAVGLCAFGDSENAMGMALRDGQVVVWRRDRGSFRQLSEQPAPAGSKLFLQLSTHYGYLVQPAVSVDGRNWIPCGDPAVTKDLPPWDRAMHVALTAGGVAGAEGVFDSFSIKPLAGVGQN